MQEEVKNWWLQAQKDLEVVRKLNKVEEYYAAVFFCQQAVEKGLKALYIKEHKQIIKVHDLVKLAREVDAPKEVLQQCAVINPVYIEVRYPESDELPYKKVNAARAKELSLLAEKILQWIELKL